MSIGLRRTIECTPGIFSENKIVERVVKGETKKEVLESPLEIKLKSNRTVDSTKDDHADFNLQNEEYCILSDNNQILNLNYTIKIVDPFHIELSNGKKEAKVLESLVRDVLDKIRKKDGLESDELRKARKFIAYGFANRLVSGVAAWRNLDTSVGAKTEIEVIKYSFNEETSSRDIESTFLTFSDVDLMGKKPFKNHRELSLEDSVVRPLGTEQSEKFDIIYQFILDALFTGGENKYVFKIKHILDLGSVSSNVYPSQLISNEKDSNGNNISKVLYSLNKNNGVKTTAAMSSQKIQNALRQFDIFSAEDKVIAFYENAVDLSNNISYRTNKNNFNFLFTKLLKGNDLTYEEYSFVLAILIKGGVYLLGEKA